MSTSLQIFQLIVFVAGEEGETETVSDDVTAESDVPALELACPAHLANLSEDQVGEIVKRLNNRGENTIMCLKFLV